MVGHRTSSPSRNAERNGWKRRTADGHSSASTTAADWRRAVRGTRQDRTALPPDGITPWVAGARPEGAEGPGVLPRPSLGRGGGCGGHWREGPRQKTRRCPLVH
ncbi:hypothetical protein F750_1033 [Streptomyces sp. PAMC 26508]|nr:hypothetical protein F750_1033 [Streptomyces sp. PAMC 26508]